jgi:hypothetical protein
MIEKIIDIVKTMIEYNMIDINRISDTDYVLERVNMYLDAKNLAMNIMSQSGM